MTYVIVYGQEYLKDYGDGWTRWSTEPSEAMRFFDELKAFKVGTYVEAQVIPYVEPERPLSAFCGAV